MILLFGIYLLLFLCFAIFNPRLFILFYFINTTKYFGFFDPEYFFVFGGLGISTPAINIISLIALLLNGDLKAFNGKYKFFFLSITLLISFGVLYPVFNDYSSIKQSLVASKGLWPIFFFGYIVSFRKRLNINFIIKIILNIGLCLSISHVLYYTINLYAPFNFIDGTFRTFYPTYSSLALFFLYCKYLYNQINNANFIILSIILMAGLFLSGHLSIAIFTILSILIHFLFFKKKISKFKMITKSVFLLTIFFSIFISNTSVNYIVSSIIKGEHYSLSSRAIYNAFRYDAIIQRPYFGYGFIHKSTEISYSFTGNAISRFSEKFEVIDSGYVDIVIKFGFVGLIFLLFTWLKNPLIVLNNQKSFDYLEILCSMFILQYTLVNYTWSVFTFDHGFIPGSIALYIILNKMEFLKKNINELY